MKELLDLLDERVASLLDEVETLRGQNAQLQRDMAEKATTAAGEMTELREALSQERSTREAAAGRIDALLQRLTKHTE